MVFKKAFTVVELLIVIVIIGILAAITLVSYTNIRQMANNSSMQSDLINVSKLLDIYKNGSSSGDAYPASLSAANINNSISSIANYVYTPDGKSYCASETISAVTYSITSTSKSPKQTTCSLNGILAWWKLNGNANDSGEYANNGTVSGASLTIGQNGVVNGAYNFTSTNYVTVPNSQSLKIPSEISISAWVNFQPAAMGIYQFLVSRYFGSYELNKGGSNQIRFEISCSDSTTHRADGPGSSLGTSGVWYHAVATFNSINGDINLYVNGSKVTTTYADPHMGCSSIGTSDLSTYLGSRGVGNGITGNLDDLRIYNRALSTSEIQDIYSAGAQ